MCEGSEDPVVYEGSGATAKVRMGVNRFKCLDELYTVLL